MDAEHFKRITRKRPIRRCTRTRVSASNPTELTLWMIMESYMNRISFLGLDMVTVGWIVLRNRASAERAEVAYRERPWWPLPGEPHIPLH